MHNLFCQYRLMRLSVPVLVAAAAVAGLVLLVTGGSGKTAPTASSVSGDNEQETSASSADLVLKWPEDDPWRHPVSPEPWLAENSSQTGLYSDNWQPVCSPGSKAGPAYRRLLRRLRPHGAPPQLHFHRSLQVLFCRWVI